MISTRWSTENHRVHTPSIRTSPACGTPPPALFKQPAVMLGVAVAAGIAIGILVKWGWRR